MKIISFRGYTFEDHDYHAGNPWDGARNQWSPRALVAARSGTSPVMGVGDISERAIPVEIGWEGDDDDMELAFDRLLGKIDITNPEPGRLVALKYDGTTYVERDAVATIASDQSTSDSVNYLKLVFISADPEWRAVEDSTTSPATITIDGSADTSQVIGLHNAGEATAYPTIDIAWTAQPSVKTDTFGWQYRKRITVTNDGSRDWVRQWVSADLGDTAALVSGGKAQSSGDDALLLLNGARVRRQMLNWNTKQTYMVFVVDHLPAETSITFELIYGNSATSVGNAAIELNRFESAYPADSWVAMDLGCTSGTATAGGASTLTDGGATWETDRWAGGFLKVVAGTGTPENNWRRIASNTSTVITVADAFDNNPDNTSQYVIWMSGFAVDGWNASAGSSTTITDSSKAWRTNEWAGATVYITSGTGSGQSATVESNTATVLTVTAAFATPPDSASFGYVSRNGQHNYLVNTTNVSPGFYTYGRRNAGLWRINRYNKSPGRVWPQDQIPGAWTPFLRLDNNDDFAVGRFYKDGTYYWPELRARRRRQQDPFYAEEGQADSIGVYDPRGYNGMYYDKRVKNAAGIGMAYVAGQGPGGEDWTNEEEYTTTQSTLTAVAAQYLDFADDPYIRLAMGVLPSDGETEISRNTKASNEIEFRTYKRLELVIDPRNWSVSVGSEEAVYDLQVTLDQYAGIREQRENKHRSLVVGYTDDNPRHVFIKSTEVLRIITDPQSTDYPCAIFTSGGTFVRSTPWAISAFEYRTPASDDEEIAGASRIWWALEPQENLCPNPTFTTDFSDWTEDADSGVTTWSRDAAVYYDSAGSGKAVVGTNGIGFATLISRAVSDAIVVDPDLVYSLAGWVRTSHADLYPIIGIRWYTSSNVYISESNVSYPGSGFAANTWVPSYSGGGADGQWQPPATAAYAKITLAVVSLNAASTGTCYFDRITFGAHLFSVTSDEESLGWGTITLAISWREGYYG